jgi:hypothetical protein
MIPLNRVGDVENALFAVEEGKMSPEEALNRLVSIIGENLEAFGVPANIRNAGEVADIISAQLRPLNLLGRLTLSRIQRGSWPDFSPYPPEIHAIERGVAVILLGFNNSKFYPNAPHRAANEIRSLLEARGHLPRPEEVGE